MSFIDLATQAFDRLLGRSVAPMEEPARPWHPGPGWQPLFDPVGRANPPLSAWHDLEVIREGWAAPVKYRDLSRYSNAYGLWWRPGAPMIDVTPSAAILPGQSPEEAAMWVAQHAQATSEPR